MGVGVFHRHGALRPTPVPSAMTYFQSGFLFRSNRPSQKRFCLISSSEAIYDIAGEPKWSQPPTRWEVHYLETLSTRAVSRGLHHNEPTEYEDKLHGWTTGRSRCCGHECIMQSSAALFHCLGLDAIGNTRKQNAANLAINDKRMKYIYIY